MKHISVLALATLLSACAVGPDYVRPALETPAAFKESKDWKVAEPRDHELGDHWWETYNDPLLNSLITQIDISNQNLAQAEAKYRQASALVQAARAAYFRPWVRMSRRPGPVEVPIATAAVAVAIAVAVGSQPQIRCR